MYRPFGTVCGWVWPLGPKGSWPGAARAVGASSGVSEVLGAAGRRGGGQEGGEPGGPSVGTSRAGSRLSSLGHAIGSKFICLNTCAVCQGGEVCPLPHALLAWLGATLWGDACAMCVVKLSGGGGSGSCVLETVISIIIIIIITAADGGGRVAASRPHQRANIRRCGVHVRAGAGTVGRTDERAHTLQAALSVYACIVGSEGAGCNMAAVPLMNTNNGRHEGGEACRCRLGSSLAPD
ncbi:hypothetical protein E2C01_036241 [Portunus trituberculatus]|uniref:Uncharacterized protein n=1 Tax=Portunus trituberculatus TaxID=210409 RepID=A0A5B7FAQ0_PORTR|nr:hypothetical protein [Portunus trituberculatus]